MSKTRWTETQQEALLEYLSRNLPDARIAQLMDISERKVRYRRTQVGKSAAPRAKAWTDAEKRQLEQYVAEGLSDPDIAKRMPKRSRNAVWNMRRVLGLVERTDASKDFLERPDPHKSPRVRAARQRAEAVLTAHRQRLQAAHQPGEPVEW
jgi:hypothetical protein